MFLLINNANTNAVYIVHNYINVISGNIIINCNNININKQQHIHIIKIVNTNDKRNTNNNMNGNINNTHIINSNMITITYNDNVINNEYYEWG